LAAAFSPGHCPRLSPGPGATKGCGPPSVTSTYWSSALNPSGGKPVFGRSITKFGARYGGSTARFCKVESRSLSAVSISVRRGYAATDEAAASSVIACVLTMMRVSGRIQSTVRAEAKLGLCSLGQGASPSLIAYISMKSSSVTTVSLRHNESIQLQSIICHLLHRGC
jgi:hypothetical protein